jgi:hypothetical protein
LSINLLTAEINHLSKRANTKRMAAVYCKQPIGLISLVRQ